MMMLNNTTPPHILDVRYMVATHLGLFVMFAHPKTATQFQKPLPLQPHDVFCAPRMLTFDAPPQFRMQGMWQHKCNLRQCTASSPLLIFALLADCFINIQKNHGISSHHDTTHSRCEVCGSKRHNATHLAHKKYSHTIPETIGLWNLILIFPDMLHCNPGQHTVSIVFLLCWLIVVENFKNTMMLEDTTLSHIPDTWWQKVQCQSPWLFPLKKTAIQFWKSSASSPHIFWPHRFMIDATFWHWQNARWRYVATHTPFHIDLFLCGHCHSHNTLPPHLLGASMWQHKVQCHIAQTQSQFWWSISKYGMHTFWMQWQSVTKVVANAMTAVHTFQMQGEVGHSQRGGPFLINTP